MAICVPTCCLTDRLMWGRPGQRRRKSSPIGRKQGGAFIRRLFSCSCLQTGEDDSHLGFEKANEKAPANSGNGESVHIVVEDLGVDNPNFHLPEMEDHALKCTMGRSASSASLCQRAKQKKKLAPLSSMPLQHRRTQGSLNDAEWDSTEDSLLLGTASSSAGDGDLLTPPVINLIPPTPSDVIDDDQFFSINSEVESVAQSSGSEGVDSVASLTTEELESEEKREEPDGGVESEEPKIESKVDVEEVSTVRLEIELKEGNVSKEKSEQKTTSLLQSSFQVPALPEYPRKRSFNAGINLLQFTEHNLGVATFFKGETLRVDMPERRFHHLPSLNEVPSVWLRSRFPGIRFQYLGPFIYLYQRQSKPLRDAHKPPHLQMEGQTKEMDHIVEALWWFKETADDLSNKDASRHDFLKAKLRLLPFSNNMESLLHQKKPAMRSCSLGETVPQSHTLQSIYCDADEIFEDEESPRQRRITVASYIPQSNVGAHISQGHDGPKAKALAEMNTEELCQWFSSIGLEKCLPFIRGAELSGAHIASIDLNTLDVLQVPGLEERESLLSAIYKELHPPNSTTQKLDSLLETFGPNNVEKFTAALISMSKSKSSPHINCISITQSSHKFRYKGQNIGCHQTNIHLVEVTVNASERIVHLRTPRDTSVGKVMESCLRMLGIDAEKDLFVLKSNKGPSEEYSIDRQIGSLPGSEARLLELNLYKRERACSDATGPPEFNLMDERSVPNKNQHEGKIQELNQQVDSLQNVILQVQELHHGLVAFCAELKSAEGQLDAEMMSCSEIKSRLSQAQDGLQGKRKSLTSLRDSRSAADAAVHNKQRPEVRLLEKMRLNCQVFKEEITLVHLNRQVARLQAALEEAQLKEREVKTSSTFSRLVSPHRPAMLVAAEEQADEDGHYSFTARWREGQGLTVVQTRSGGLCLNDRLVEVNGVSVLDSREDELADLLQSPVSQLVVLRKTSFEPPPRLQPQQTSTESGHRGESAPQ